jgi:Tfp pilus assembly protein PilE
MASKGQGGAITSVEAFVLAVMTVIVVAIAVPSYITMQHRSSDTAARTQLREAAETLDAAGRSTRCLERTVGGRTWHLTFPEQSLLRGGCP